MLVHVRFITKQDTLCTLTFSFDLPHTVRLSTSDMSVQGEEEIAVRQATHEDYAAVMSIGDVYGGRDYLKEGYHRFLDDPNVYAYVATVDGKTVRTSNLYLMDVQL